MKLNSRRICLGLVAVLAFAAFAGCTRDKHRKVQVIEEQRESEVVEEGQGYRMIVE